MICTQACCSSIGWQQHSLPLVCIHCTEHDSHSPRIQCSVLVIHKGDSRVGCNTSCVQSALSRDLARTQARGIWPRPWAATHTCLRQVAARGTVDWRAVTPSEVKLSALAAVGGPICVKIDLTHTRTNFVSGWLTIGTRRVLPRLPS